MSEAFRWLGSRGPDGSFDNKRAPRAIEKTWWRCPNGHEWEATPNKIKNGNRCPYCAHNAKLTPHQKEQIYHLIREGHSNLEITASVGCGAGPILRARKLLSIPARASKDDIIEGLIREGRSTSDIKNLAGCSAGTVCKVRKRVGIPDPRYVNNAALDDLITQGKGNKEIMQLIGCTNGPIDSARRRLGICAKLHDPSRRATIEKLVLDGLSNTQIIEASGCSEGMVLRARKRLAKPARLHDHDRLTERDAQAMELFNKGHTASEVARALDVSAATVSNIRRRLGLPKLR